MEENNKNEISEITKEAAAVILEGLEPSLEVIRKNLADIKEILSKHWPSFVMW